MTAPSLARSPGLVVQLGPALWRLSYIALADLAFLFGVLVPYLTDDDVPPVDSTWNALFWPGLVSVFCLPLVACGVAVFSGAGLARRDGGARAVDLAAVALSVAGVLVYISPWGRDAISWLLA